MQYTESRTPPLTAVWLIPVAAAIERGVSETLCMRLVVSCESVLEVGVEGGEAFVPPGHGAFPAAFMVSDREVDELTG